VTGRRLIIGGTWPRTRPLTTAEFLWRASSDESSFHTRLDPQLAGIGSVPAPNTDLVALAVLVFLADRTIRRPSKGWERAIELELPVFDVDRWQSMGTDLCHTLEILTADTWRATFRKRAAGKVNSVAERPQVDRVLLFSGGADSLCGAIRSLAAGERLLLVSHWDWGGHSAYQDRLARWLARRFPNQVHLRQHQLQRRSTQLGGGPFGDEPTRRSRSLLFIALGLAHASIEPRVPLWVAENGYAALNPPLAGERRGALSTRTTHPVVLSSLHRLIAGVGGHGDLSNPFAMMTKGEMYAEAATVLGADDASKLLSMSHSCAHVRWAMGTGLRPDTQCGICFGCLVRRSAFLAAGLEDRTTYLHTAISPKNQRDGLRKAARQEILTVRYAGRRGVSAADLLSIGLPDTTSLDDALHVARRGLAELAAVVDAVPDLLRVS
jgi:7-cyano-7-deazaguanine synthase in queuosine biosynthesis